MLSLARVFQTFLLVIVFDCSYFPEDSKCRETGKPAASENVNTACTSQPLHKLFNMLYIFFTFEIIVTPKPDW